MQEKPGQKGIRGGGLRQSAKRCVFAALAPALLAACSGVQPATPEAAAVPVLTGLEVLARDSMGPLRGLRVGLITNHTGVVGAGDARTSSIDLLHASPHVTLVRLFAPEHGFSGRANAGEHIGDERDRATGLPILSLYGETRKPTAAMLEGLDALVFDIQDIGTRYYTYIWTMAHALEAAAEHGVRFVVLDRPNPIGGTLMHGNVLDTAYRTFVGLYPVPMRHGLTAGEMAQFINREYGLDAQLTVVPVEGWQRSQWYDETGLPWVAPSPNMPSLESAAHYPGTCLFEGTNLSVGRGTDEAFSQIGAPWVQSDVLVERLRARNLPGVRIDTVRFTPVQPGDGKYADTAVRGVRYTVTDRASYDPSLTAVATLVELRALHADSLTFRVAHFDRLAGTDSVRLKLLAGESVASITAPWQGQLERFAARRAPYLLYR